MSCFKLCPWATTSSKTRLLFEPTQNIQRAGLFLIQDGDNKLELIRGYCDFGPPGCPGNAIFFDYAKDGAAGNNFATTTAATGEAYLRIVRQGRAYTGYVSGDGVHWTLVGTHIAAADFAPIGVGLFANYTPLGAGEIPADFDYFTWNELSQHIYLPSILAVTRFSAAVANVPGKAAPCRNGSGGALAASRASLTSGWTDRNTHRRRGRGSCGSGPDKGNT